MANYAVSDPEYKNCFAVFELEDAIFEPNGGGHLETHRYFDAELEQIDRELKAELAR